MNPNFTLGQMLEFPGNLVALGDTMQDFCAETHCLSAEEGTTEKCCKTEPEKDEKCCTIQPEKNNFLPKLKNLNKIGEEVEFKTFGDEFDSVKGRERYQLRLWNHLFESLKRAIDEIYLLCETENDITQISEAVKILAEAGVAFAELRVRCFTDSQRRIKIHSSSPQGHKTSQEIKTGQIKISKLRNSGGKTEVNREKKRISIKNRLEDEGCGKPVPSGKRKGERGGEREGERGGDYPDFVIDSPILQERTVLQLNYAKPLSIKEANLEVTSFKGDEDRNLTSGNDLSKEPGVLQEGNDSKQTRKEEVVKGILEGMRHGIGSRKVDESEKRPDGSQSSEVDKALSGSKFVGKERGKVVAQARSRTIGSVAVGVTPLIWQIEPEKGSNHGKSDSENDSWCDSEELEDLHFHKITFSEGISEEKSEGDVINVQILSSIESNEETETADFRGEEGDKGCKIASNSPNVVSVKNTCQERRENKKKLGQNGDQSAPEANQSENVIEELVDLSVKAGQDKRKVGISTNRQTKQKTTIEKSQGGKEFVRGQGETESLGESFFEKPLPLLNVFKQESKDSLQTKAKEEPWHEKKSWVEILVSPQKKIGKGGTSISRATLSSLSTRNAGSVQRLHEKLMALHIKKKTPLEMKKEVDEKLLRALKLRQEMDDERRQRLQRSTERLRRVSEWQAVKRRRLREGMQKRQQNGDARHEAHLAEIVRRAGDESSKVNEVRFIITLSDENKKLSLRQKLQDSETRRLGRLQSLRQKQKEEIAREEAALERRKQLEAERQQKISEAQKKKEEALARREEEKKTGAAAREARTVEAARKKEERAKAQQEEAALTAQRLRERLQHSEARRQLYLAIIRERASLQSDQSDRRNCFSDSPEILGRLNTLVSPSGEITRYGSPIGRKQAFNYEGILKSRGRVYEGDRGSPSESGGEVGERNHENDKPGILSTAQKRRVKKIRQRLAAKKFDFLEPGLPEGGSVNHKNGGSRLVGIARSKIVKYQQELQRQLEVKGGGGGGGGGGGSTAIEATVTELIKILDNRELELNIARQLGLIEFLSTTISTSHSSRPQAPRVTSSLIRLLRVLLSHPTNRLLFVARNLLPPSIPILAVALEKFSSVSSTASVSELKTGNSSDIVVDPDTSKEVLKVNVSGKSLLTINIPDSIPDSLTDKVTVSESEEDQKLDVKLGSKTMKGSLITVDGVVSEKKQVEEGLLVQLFTARKGEDTPSNEKKGLSEGIGETSGATSYGSEENARIITLEGLMWIVSSILGQSGGEERILEMQEDLLDLVVACEIIPRLRDLFAIFDCPHVEGAPLPNPVLLGLQLLEAMTVSGGKILNPDDQLREKTERQGNKHSIGKVNNRDLKGRSIGEQGRSSERLEERSIRPEKEILGEPGIKQKPQVRNEPSISVQNSGISSSFDDGKEVIATGNEVEMSFTIPEIKLLPCEDNNEGTTTERLDFQKSQIQQVDDELSEEVDYRKSPSVTSSGNSKTFREESKHFREDFKTSREDLSKEKRGKSNSVEIGVQNIGKPSRAFAAVLTAFEETGLVGLPSLLTAVLLQANPPRGSLEQAAQALPPNFEEVATSVLRILNNIARGDLILLQNCLSQPDLSAEFFHLVSFLLSYSIIQWKTPGDKINLLLNETLSLIGYFSLQHEHNQSVLRWGKNPTILHKLTELPFPYFIEPFLSMFLFEALIAACFGSEQNCRVVSEELSLSWIYSYLTENQNPGENQTPNQNSEVELEGNSPSPSFPSPLNGSTALIRSFLSSKRPGKHSSTTLSSSIQSTSLSSLSTTGQSISRQTRVQLSTNSGRNSVSNHNNSNNNNNSSSNPVTFRELESSSISNSNASIGTTTSHTGQTKSRKEPSGSSVRAPLDSDFVKGTASGNIRRQGFQSGLTLTEQCLSPIVRNPSFSSEIREKAVKFFSSKLNVLKKSKPFSSES